MSRTSKALKRLGVAGIVVATIGAGVPALIASSAQAATGGATTQLVISPLSQSGAAGTCLLYKVTPLNATSERPGDTPNITVQLTENPVSDTQDVDFCTVAGTTTVRGTTTATEPASYVNGASVPSRQTYTPTTTNVSPAPAAGGGPDSASGASGQATATNTNPSGTDSDRFTGQNDGTSAATVAQPNDGSIVFGVVGAIAGGANITAFIDNGAGGGTAGDYTRQAGEITANQPATATFTAGNTAEAVTVVDAEPETGSAPINSTITFTVTLKNASGATVSGVTPVAEITAGPDGTQTSPALAAQPVTCGTTDNTGTTTCSYTTRSTTGTDTIRVYVNQTCGTSAAFQTCEPSDEITRTVAPATSSARNIALTPKDATTVAGQTRIFEAKVVDVNGTPVPDVEVTFSESGAGRIVDGNSGFAGTSFIVTATGADGIARATVTSAAAETGTQEVTAQITGVGTRDASGKFTRTGGSDSTTTQCGQAKGAGAGATASTPAGNCSDQTTNTFVTAASPTATPTATASPTSGSCRIVTVTINTKTVNATGLASVTASGATPGATVELQGYSQNHYGTANFGNDTTNPDRTGVANSSGSVTFSDLRPGSNTRLRARQVGCAYGNSDVINVRTQLSLQVTRTAPRTYRFNVDSIPARPGGLIVSIFRITGTPCAAGVEPRNCPGEVFVGQTRVSAVNGAGAVTLTFGSTYPAREQFVLKTGQDAQNAPGRSNVRDLAIF